MVVYKIVEDNEISILDKEEGYNMILIINIAGMKDISKVLNLIEIQVLITV